MKNVDVPLQNFEVQFSADGLEKTTKCKAILVTVLRFLDKDIVPAIEEFSMTLPSSNEIEQRPFRTAEDGRYLLHIERSVTQFKEEQLSRLEAYLHVALRGLSMKDSVHVSDLVTHKFNKTTETISRIALTASQKFDDFAIQGHAAEFSEDENRTGSAVSEAGVNFRTPIDRLFRG
jgi:hypothetical protein